MPVCLEERSVNKPVFTERGLQELIRINPGSDRIKITTRMDLYSMGTGSKKVNSIINIDRVKPVKQLIARECPFKRRECRF